MVSVGDFAFVGIDLHLQQRGSHCLPLRVCPQGQSSAAAQRFMQEKIECSQIRKLEALHLSFYKIAKECFYALGGHLAHQDRIMPLMIGDDADVGGVAFVAGARVGDAMERDLHYSMTSTRV